MEDLGRLLLAITAAFGCALVAPILLVGARGRRAGPARWAFMAPILACPLLIPAGRVGLRALAAFVVTEVAFKVVDFFRPRDRAGGGFDLCEYLRFLVPFPTLGVVAPDHKRRLPRPDPPGPHVARIVGGAAVFAAGFLALDLCTRVARLRSDFALDHVVKLVLFVPVVEALSRALYGLERLAGFATAPIVHNAYRARTVGAFWRRFDSRVHDWLDRNVFRPAGGRRAPARAIVLVFLVSGLHHELMFGIATSCFDGRQLAFFLLQIPPVLASRRLERLARRRGIAGKLLAHGATTLYLAVTSVLFFRGVSRVFPNFYAGGVPPR